MSSSHKNHEFLHLHVRVYANRLYQQDRGRILERRENAVKAASIVLGTAAFADVKGFFNDDKSLLVWIILAFVCMNAVSLVFQWGNKARDASKRSSEWTTLERDMESVGAAKASDDELNAWRARAAEVEAGEPSINQHLMWRSIRRANEALDAELVSPEGKIASVLRYLPRPWPRAIS